MTRDETLIENDEAYDEWRMARRARLAGYASEKGESIDFLEDCLAGLMAASAFDRREARARLKASRERLGDVRYA
jgi:hypothetical protein